MKEQLKKILAGKCHNEEATNRAVEEVCNLIESKQKNLEYLDIGARLIKGDVIVDYNGNVRHLIKPNTKNYKKPKV